MFYGAKNGKLQIGNTDMDYISFGSGQKVLIMIPGLGDGLKTVKGMTIPFAVMYRNYAKKYRVYVFSRKNHMEQGYSTRSMAGDIKTSMDKLGIKSAYIMGVSQGGMIAQYVAIDYPKVVEKLVLAVTLSRQNDTVQRVVADWIRMAEAKDYHNIMIDTTEKSYTKEYVKKKNLRLFYPWIGRFGGPKDLGRFIIQAESCRHHDAFEELVQIHCPVLVIGGDSDQIVGGESSREIALKIPHSKLIVYKGLGHMTYEEAADFNQQVIKFLEEA